MLKTRVNLATVIRAGLMKSKLTESQHIDIRKPINLKKKFIDGKTLKESSGKYGFHGFPGDMNA